MPHLLIVLKTASFSIFFLIKNEAKNQGGTKGTKNQLRLLKRKNTRPFSFFNGAPTDFLDLPFAPAKSARCVPVARTHSMVRVLSPAYKAARRLYHRIC